MQDSAHDGTASTLAPVDVVDALDRVLQSPTFRRSGRSRGFLAFVVTETLAGRGERLSERTVARGAMQRGGTFDGRGDATVRVQASRVRKALESYYSETGSEDPIRIELPRGSYVPLFMRNASPEPDVARVPGVVVTILTSSGESPAGLIARSLSESLVQHLAAHGHIRVVGPVDLPAEARTSATAAGASSILTGHVSLHDGEVSVAVRVVDAESVKVLWSTEEVIPLEGLARFEAQELWSRAIASRVGDPSGPVIRQELDRQPAGGTEPELAARLAFYAHLYRETGTSLAEAIAKLDVALDSGFRTAQLLAMRGALANEASIHGLTEMESELDRAEALAREALALDGSNAHAHLVLSWPLQVRGHVDVAVLHVETAVRLAPYQPFYLIAGGIAICSCGQWQRGAELIHEAHRLNPGMSSLTHAWLAMGHLVEADYGRALAESSLLPADDGYVWGPLMRSIALSGLGYVDQARAEAARARAMRPDVMDDVGGYLGGMMRLEKDVLDRLAHLVPDPVD